MIEVCMSSFYLVFLILILMKNSFVFLAIKKGEKSYEHLLTLLIIFDFIILLTLPIAMVMVKNVC